MKHLFFVVLCFFGLLNLYSQQPLTDKERMIESLKQSGYMRQEGNTLIYKVKRASDTAQARLMYGSLFRDTKYTIRFEMDGKYFDNVKIKPVEKTLPKKETPEVKEYVTNNTVAHTGTLASAEQLYLTGGWFLIRSARAYKYITLPDAGRVAGNTPSLFGYSNSENQNYFKLVAQPGGYYKIETHNGLYLQLKNSSNNTPLISAETNNSDAQLWKFTPAGNGMYKIVAKNDFYLSASATTLNDNAKITGSQAVSSIFNSQLWHMIRMTGDRQVKMTLFNPLTQGFHFANTFDNTRFIAGVEWKFGGRCAGMVFGALDYYYNNEPAPVNNQLPEEGTVLSTYIGARQEVTSKAHYDRYTELNFNPGGARTMEFFNWGLQGTGGGRLQELKNFIDAGKPMPIILFNPAGDLINYPHHCVLAIGYSLNRYQGDLGLYKEDVKIYTYDPNYPNQVTIMMANLADMNNPRYFNVNTSNVTPWLTYFHNSVYSVQRPLTNRDANECPGTRQQLTAKNYRGTNHSNQSFKCAVANRADFYGATFMQVDFENASLDSAIFYGANVRNSNFSSTSLTGTNFYGADLKDTRFLFTRADKALFEGADMKLARFNSGVLTNSSFRGADLHRTQFNGTNFTGSHFTRASLSHTSGENANFSNTELALANFQNAYLKGAVFRGAIIEGTDFRNADLTNADFTGVIIRTRPLLDGAKLEGAIGLPR